MPQLDCHCHLLPGLGDGPTDLAGSLALCRMLVEQGIDEAVATPDWRHPGRPLDDNAVLVAWQGLEHAVAQAELPLRLHLGACQHLATDAVAGPVIDAVRPLGGGPLVLFAIAEPPPADLCAILGAVTGRGNVPVLSEPERLATLDDDHELWKRIGPLPILLQIGLGSLLGHHGREVAERAASLLERHPERCLLASGCRSPRGAGAPSWPALPIVYQRYRPSSLGALGHLLDAGDEVELPRDPEAALAAWQAGRASTRFVRRRRSITGGEEGAVAVVPTASIRRRSLRDATAPPAEGPPRAMEDGIPIAESVATPPANPAQRSGSTTTPIDGRPAIPVARPTGRFSHGEDPLTDLPPLPGRFDQAPESGGWPVRQEDDWLAAEGGTARHARGSGAPPGGAALDALDQRIADGDHLAVTSELSARLATCPEEDRAERARILRRLAVCASRADDPEQALEWYRASLDLYRRLGDRDGEARCLHDLTALLSRRGAFDLAEEYCRHGLLLVETAGDTELGLAFLAALARLCHRRRDREGATSALRRAVDTARDAGGHVQLLQFREQLARQLGRSGECREAAQLLRRNIEEAGQEHRSRACSAAWRLAQLLDPIADKPELIGRLTAAVDGYKDLAASGAAVELPEALPAMELRLAEVLLKAGVAREALFRFRYAFDDQRRAGTDEKAGRRQIRCLLGMANASHALGDRAGAEQALVQARQEAAALDDAEMLTLIDRAKQRLRGLT